MPPSVTVLEAVSVAAFLFYGTGCLVSSRLAAEFARYRLERWRVVVGWLEIAGALGLVAGEFFPPLKIFAAAGLAALMACGLWARWRIRDPWYALLPAAVLGIVNTVIAIHTLAQRP